jgi:transcriptional regulator with XRE-family HTH domain
MTAREPRIRLAQYIERRISALALEYAEVCRRAGISDETLSKVRKGAGARSSTYTKLEHALGWARGSIAAILDGGEPTPLDTPPDQAPSTPEGSPLSRELTFAQRLLATLIRELDLSPEEADEVWRRVRPNIEATHRSHTDRTVRNETERPTG